MPRLHLSTAHLLLPLLVSLTPLVAGAAHGRGRIELNQASIDAGGGFPVVVTAPANYVLTSDLLVPASTDGFVLETSGVAFDLNGFRIQGPATCVPGACAGGVGSAIRPGLSVAFGRRVSVRNGTIEGFAGTCLSLASDAQVADLLVRSCGIDGIAVSGGSLVERNRVGDTGQHGIRMSGTVHPPLFSGNAVARAGLAGGTERTVLGGRPGAGNSCDDGACSARGRRRLYLSAVSDSGANAGALCDTGFRVPHLAEIADPSGFEWDFARGGGGPVVLHGWGNHAGLANCGGYTSSAGLGLVLSFDANDGTWSQTLLPCADSFRIWCIEE